MGSIFLEFNYSLKDDYWWSGKLADDILEMQGLKFNMVPMETT